jgi:hypothetical protein
VARINRTHSPPTTHLTGVTNPPEPLRLRRCACGKSDGFAFGHTCYVYGPRAEFFLSEKGKRVKVKRVLLIWSEVGLFYPTDATVNLKGLPGKAKAYAVAADRRGAPAAKGDTRE